MYENKIIKQIHAATDIVSLISETVQLKKDGDLLFGICPFHKEKEASFTVDAKNKRYHCYGCGAGGNVYSFVMQRDNCSFEEAVIKLAVRAGISQPQILQDLEFEKKKKRLLEMNALAFAHYYQKGLESEKAKDYLKNTRRLTEETIQNFGLGVSGSFGQELYQTLLSCGYTKEEMIEGGLIGHKEDCYDKFWDRIMFPIFDKGANIVGFGGRIMGEGKPKYLNSPETIVFDKSHELYGLFAAKNQNKSFVLCEGYLDVISMHQAGFKTAVASLGTSLTVSQAHMIAEYTNTVFIAYDSDEPGIKATSRAIPMLEKAGLRVFVISTAPYKDVDDLLKADDENSSEMKKRFKEAVPGKTFLARQLDKKSDEFYNKVVELIV